MECAREEPSDLLENEGPPLAVQQEDAPQEASADEEEIDVSPRGAAVSSLGTVESLGSTQMFVYDNVFTILPSTISRFEQLKVLKLFSNEVKYLPDVVGELPKLEQLQISTTPTGLSNFWPPGKLAELKTLELHQLPPRASASAIPSDICQLEALERISICHFSVSFLPPEIGSLQRLKELDFSFNKLRFLPKEIARLSSLKTLRVSSNKLVELPADISTMACLTSIDVSYNKLTSLSSLNLQAMTSLQEFNVQFNKLYETGEIPEWVTCNVEGNNLLADAEAKQLFADQDTDVLCTSHQRARKYIRRQAIQQQVQVTFTNSRKHKLEELQSASEKMIKDDASQHSAKSTKSEADEAVMSEEPDAEEPKDEGSQRHDQEPSEKMIKDDAKSTKIEADEAVMNEEPDAEEPKDGGSQRRDQEPLKDNAALPVAEEPATNATQAATEHKRLSRHSEGDEENPKPSKRKKSVGTSSAISYKYNKESFCGVRDLLPDGFFDAGRDRPFVSLDTLERENLHFGVREVILVDRTIDEDLDVIASSANQLLSCYGIQPGTSYALLALFVSDCFGGSDKTLNVKTMRRSALGQTTRSPFVCSCSSSYASSEGPSSIVPSMHALSEEAVRHVKLKRGSNVVPLGSLSYGVCRHRAILFKYLCDRANPVIPCELVRGYLDYTPHAWNVIHVPRNGTDVRLLVDACRPLDIRPESDTEYFCRYIPLRRIHVQGPAKANLESEAFVPLFYEEIGSGSSGAVVHKCNLGGQEAAAKVRPVDGCNNKSEGAWLSELRIHCSLGEHPCVVSFYGHQLSFDSLVLNGSGKKVEGPQLAIFMEYVKGGSLESLIRRLKEDGNIYMPPRLALHVARSVASGLAWLHSRGIIHRDIKSSNILVDLETQSPEDDPVVKICDFDSAVPVESSSIHTCYLAHHGLPLTDVCIGTPRWIAPEVLDAMYSHKQYGQEADIWSFGCLLLELLTLEVPYVEVEDAKIHRFIEGGSRPSLTWKLEELDIESARDRDALEVLLNLYESCTEYDPVKRPTSAKAVNILNERDELMR